jgi:phosphoribosyl-AMP cyclohydrolase
MGAVRVIEPSELRYDTQGLIPAILQDHASHEVVMLGYMNEESLRQTLDLGQAVFWSRSRQELWHKGATSGDYVRVLEIRTDCDSDALVLQVELLGGGVCHTGAHSCFVEEDDSTPRLVGSASAS